MRSLDEQQTPCRGDALPIVVMTTQFPYRWIFASLESKQAFVARWGWEGGGGVLSIMAYMGRLRQKAVPLTGFRYMKG